MVLFAIVFCLIVALGLGVAAAISDVRGMIIPNIYAAGVLLSFVPAYAIFLLFAGESGFFQSWAMHLGAFAAMFLVSFVLFSLKLFGAGDSKLCTAYALWAGFDGLSAFAFYMALAGGLLGIATLLLRKYKPIAQPREGTWLARAQAGENAVPYGLAITAGAVASFLWLGYLSPANLAALAG